MSNEQKLSNKELYIIRHILKIVDRAMVYDGGLGTYTDNSDVCISLRDYELECLKEAIAKMDNNLIEVDKMLDANA